MPTTLAYLIAFAFLGLTVACWALIHVRHLRREIAYMSVALGACCERVGGTDGDIDAYHAAIHPECVQAGER